MPTVRTTMEPWKTMTVSEREAENLRRQGLLVEDEPEPAPVKAKKT